MSHEAFIERIKSGAVVEVFFGDRAKLAHPEITKAIYQNYMNSDNKKGRWLILTCAATDFDRDDYFELVKTDIFLYSAITNGPREDKEILDFVRNNTTWLSYETLYSYGQNKDLSSDVLINILDDAYSVYLIRKSSLTFCEYLISDDKPYGKQFYSDLIDAFPGIELLLDMNCDIQELLLFTRSKSIKLSNIPIDFNI